MVISAVPLNGTPLIFLGVAKAVAVAEFPVTLPVIGLVTVKPVKVPTVVNEELTMLAGKPMPVRPLASTGNVIFTVPSKATPLIVLAVESLVAFAARVAVAALPVTLPAIGLVTVRLESVPTEVSDEFTTDEFNVVPVKDAAAEAPETTISADPSNGTPFMFRAVASFVAVPALPVTLPAIGAVTVNPLRVPTEVMAGCAAFVTTKAVFAVISTGIHCVPFHPKTWPETGIVAATLFPFNLFAFQIADALFADTKILAPVLFTVIVVSSPSNVTAPTFPFIETTDPDASAKLAHAFL